MTKDEKVALLIWDVGFAWLLLLAFRIGDRGAFLGGLAAGLYINYRAFKSN